MSEPLQSRYDPAQVEAHWIDAWEAAEVGRADAERGRTAESFCVMIPPPNVTGVLHMGHALNNSLQDLIVRRARMQGRETLWVPGTDHAGIATQAVVEKKLYQEQGTTREELGRDAFLGEVWKWKDHHGDRILDQLRRMGCSCDWSRTAFTLDEELSRAVREAFVRLWEKGLVYRGARLVNWDCVLQTAVSDDEIEYAERTDGLWYLRYPVKGRPDRHVTVATTRPETMLGDTGVAVNPDDPRYADLVGQTLVLPLIGREIPIVADDSVDAEFGTGAVKVTPGHDPADYERGARHGLPIVNLLESDGSLNANAGEFEGLPREEARKVIVARMEELGLLEKTEEIVHKVPLSDRSKSPIEPLVSEQWFVKMEPLAQPAIRAVETGALEIVPQRWTKVYLDWLLNVRDWCISRQLWWGHRIPVWYDEDDTPIASREDLELGDPHPTTGKPIVRQDPDVMDTWASSWLWPFATLGWPDRTPDLDAFYPTQFLSTGRDIIYLWVARMVMAGYEFLDHLPEEQRCPFSVCYIHANVLDAQGRRMSKSLGNGIDPIDMIDTYGADAMRFTLAWLTTEGQDIKLDPVRFEMGRNFMNKLWNAARFTLSNLEGHDPAPAGRLELVDRWILTELTRAQRAVDEALDGYKFNHAVEAIYDFTWRDFCDWYLELVKPRLRAGGEAAATVRATLVRVLGGICTMLHPVAPHITEEVWDKLRPWSGADGLLAQSTWALEPFDDASVGSSVAALQELVGRIRNLRAQSRVPERESVDVLVVPSEGDSTAAELRPLVEDVCRLARCSSLTLAQAEPPSTNASDVLSFGVLYVDLEGKVDLSAERARLSKELEKARGQLEGTRRKLSNENFVSRAPEAVVQNERDRLAEASDVVARLEGLLAALGEG